MNKHVNYETISNDGTEILPSKSIWKSIKNGVLSITVEPIGASIMIVVFMYSLISQQYIYQYVAQSYGLNSTSQNKACANSSSVEAKVSAESSQWVLYVNIAAFLPSLITTIIIGSWGDTVGRKLPLLIGLFGYLVMITCYLVVLAFELPIQYLLIGRLLCGLTGELPVILTCVFAYLADISTQENRTVKLAIGDGTLGIGGIVGALLSGVWVEKQGFVPPFIFLVALMIATILYVLFFVKESLPVGAISTSVKIKALFSLKPFRSIKNTLFVNLANCMKILGMVMCYFLASTILTGSGDVSTLYVLSPPFCWSSMLIGYTSAVTSTAFLFSWATIKLLKGRASEYVIGVIGILSKTSFLLFYAFGKTTLMLFIGILTQSLCILTFTITRSIASKLVGADGQGAVFSVIGLAQSTSQLIASFIFNPIYSKTVAWNPGFVFIVMIGFEGLLFFLFSLVYYFVRKDIATQSYEAIPQTSDEHCYDNA